MWFKIVVKILKLLAFFLKGKLHIVLYTLILHDLFMARFEQSRERKGRRDSRDGSSRRGRGRFRDGPRRRDSSRRGFDRGKIKSFDKSRRRDNEEVTMHKVTCDKCSKECEVPFKPSSDKPVYCDDCFKENRDSGERRGIGRDSRPNGELKEINKKLDKILKLLK